MPRLAGLPDPAAAAAAGEPYRVLANIAEALGKQHWRDGHNRQAIAEWQRAAGYRTLWWERF